MSPVPNGPYLVEIALGACNLVQYLSIMVAPISPAPFKSVTVPFLQPVLFSTA